MLGEQIEAVFENGVVARLAVWLGGLAKTHGHDVGS
jgi:hypothetical protein